MLFLDYVIYACLTVGRPAANSEAGVSLVGACVREKRKIKENGGKWGELGWLGWSAPILGNF